MADRPVTTLFLIESVDGKISTGDSDERDVDKDFPKIPVVKEGLHQYYDIEKHTDMVSLNTGRVMAKIGVNTMSDPKEKIPVSFVIIDSKPHLTESGTAHLAKWVKKLYLVTTHKDHSAFALFKKYPNIVPIFFDKTIDLKKMLSILKKKYGIKRLTIQSGGTMNSFWIREKLIDRVRIVMAPCLIGGTDTQSLIGGESLHSEKDLKKISSLELVSVKKLKHSYLELLYKVV